MGGWLHTEIKCRFRESNLDTITHPSTNRAGQAAYVNLIDRDRRVTTTPNRRQITFPKVLLATAHDL